MSRVTSTSCTRRVSWTTAAVPAQTAPASAPADAARRGRKITGISGKARATQVAARPPTAICPSPPMLMTFAVKHSAIPAAVSRYGVALLRATAMRSSEPKAPLASEP